MPAGHRQYLDSLLLQGKPLPGEQSQLPQREAVADRDVDVGDERPIGGIQPGALD